MSIVNKRKHRLRRTLLATFLCCCLSVSITRAQDRIPDDVKVTISNNHITLKNLLKEIQTKTKVNFYYSDEDISASSFVSVKFDNIPLRAALDDLLTPRGLVYIYSAGDKSIVIRAAKKNTLTGSAETKTPVTVKGVVTNNKGELLVGVNVMVQGTRRIAVTDALGRYTLKDISPDALLRFENVGYESKSLWVDGRQNIDLQLFENANELDETVVKGYYNTTKRLNTGNVSVVKGEDIMKQPISNPITALEGRVPGLYIAQTSGVPGAGITVTLRGKNSISSGTDPLYIIDNVPYSSKTLSSSGNIPSAAGSAGLSPFAFINSADIESIEILKDADATAIYGSRGANGVVLITTKKAKAGATSFSLDASTGIGKVPRFIDLLNTQQYLQMRHEAFNNDGKTPVATDYDVNGAWDSTRYTDWQKVLLGGTSHIANIQAALSGGDANTRFSLNGGYRRETVIYPTSNADQLASMRINITHNSINKKFYLIFSAAYANDDNRLPSVDLTGSALSLSPNAPALYTAAGALNWQNNTWSNPLSYIFQTRKSITDNLTANMNLRYQVLPGLNLRTNLGYVHTQTNESTILPGISQRPPNNDNPASRRNNFANRDNKTWTIEPQADYAKRIGHFNLEWLIGTTLQQTIQTNLVQQASGFSSDALIQNVAAATTKLILSSTYTQYKYLGIFSRINLNWKETYLLNLTARRDGSSRFGPGRQFGNFGAVGAAWIFSNERFMRGALPFLSFGKLRASYGSSGNEASVDYQYLSTYSANSYAYQGLIGLSPTRIANSYFGWELVKKLEGGISLGFLKDQLQLGVSYYRNRSGNQLINYPLPYTTGFYTIYANFPAIVQNTGVELELNASIVKSKHFNWVSTANITIPHNKLVAFPGLLTSPYTNSMQIGESLFGTKYFHYTGIDMQTGVMQFEDVNKDGQISWPQDLQTFKTMTQSLYGGMQNSLTYKSWQLDIFIQFVKQTGRALAGEFGMPGMLSNQPTTVLQRWQVPGNQATIQQFTQNYGSPAGKAYSLFYSYGDNLVADRSFVRLKNISLNYTLPVKWVQAVHFRQGRIYLQVQNLLTFTHYKGLDPETGVSVLPPLRMITTGLQFTL